MLNTYQQIANTIVREQSNVIGPIAWKVASKVNGITVSSHEVILQDNDNGKLVIEKLVAQYTTLFGQASVEVCKDAVKRIFTKLKDASDIPDILK